MLDGLQMNVPPAMNKRWQGMITIGICELGGGGQLRFWDNDGKVNTTNGGHYQSLVTELG